MSGSAVTNLISALRQNLDSCGASADADVEALEDFLTTTRKLLHPNHYLR